MRRRFSALASAITVSSGLLAGVLTVTAPPLQDGQLNEILTRRSGPR